MDSTLRGNPGPEIRAIEEILEPIFTVIAPAFPRNDRFTVDGCQLINNVPVSETELAQDPESPVQESHLPTLLSSHSTAPIGHVPLNTVITGMSAVQKSIQSQLAQGKRWIVFDAKTDSDLRCIAEAAQQHTRILWVGSAGLAEMLPTIHHRSAVKINRPSPSKGPVLLISGSMNKITRSQISELLNKSDAFMIHLDIAEAIRDQNAAASHCINIGRSHLNKESTLVISSAYEYRCIGDGLAEAAKRGLGRMDLSRRIARTLGMIAAGLASPRLGRFVLTGGSTAFEVCSGLGIECLHLVEELAPGMPLARFNHELLGEGWIVTKAGAFGDRDALNKAVHAVRGDN
jgi:D-threonate/D-erythronate kinase